MEFGRIDTALLDKQDFSLPAEPIQNSKVLSGKNLNGKVWVGCSKWGREEWVGKIYPLKTKERDFLQHYVQHFNCVELNATHYKIIGEKGIGDWKKKAGEADFRFCPKMYKGISHAGNLTDKPFIINEFLRGIRAFEDKLGPVFIQLHERFSPNRIREVEKFFSMLPGDIQFFLEVRHERWFQEKTLNEVCAFLSSKNVGLVITDTAGRRDCCHMHLTIPKAFIRFVGNSLHATDYSRVDEWAERIKYWLDQGTGEINFMIHSGNESVAPELAAYVVKQFNDVCKLALPAVRFISK